MQEDHNPYNLNTILIDIRQTMASNELGFPDELREARTQGKLSDFIAACQNLVEHGWNDDANNNPSLSFSSGFFKHPVKAYFARLCLLKLLYEEAVIDSNLIDKNWFRKMRDTLHREFEQLKQNSPNKLIINGREINSLEELEAIRSTARQRMQEHTQTENIVIKIVIPLFLFNTYILRKLLPDRMILAINVLLILAALYGHYKLNQSITAHRTLMFAHNAEARLPQHPEAIMSNENIQKFFLLNDQELNKIENSAPQPN